MDTKRLMLKQKRGIRFKLACHQSEKVIIYRMNTAIDSACIVCAICRLTLYRERSLSRYIARICGFELISLYDFISILKWITFLLQFCGIHLVCWIHQREFSLIQLNWIISPLFARRTNTIVNGMAMVCTHFNILTYSVSGCSLYFAGIRLAFPFNPDREVQFPRTRLRYYGDESRLFVFDTPTGCYSTDCTKAKSKGENGNSIPFSLVAKNSSLMDELCTMF